MSVMVRIEHRVSDYEKWKRAFDTDPTNRVASGARSYAIMRGREDRNLVLVDMVFDTESDAEAYVRKLEAAWRNAGKALLDAPAARIALVVTEGAP